jgi:hypothetical protein
LIADGSTLRAGRILAPLGIRYVVVPKTDGVVSTVDDPVPLPEGLLAALQNQLDLGSVYGPPTLEIFTNQAWFPVGAQLTGATAEASRLAGEESLARADLTQAAPSMVGADADSPAGTNQVAPGVVHIAVPFDERIRLEVDGVAIPSRPGFGVTTAFDIVEPGSAVLSYERDSSRALWRVAQTILWLAMLVVAAGAHSPFGRRRGLELHDETLIDLSEGPSLGGVVIGEALGLPMWDDAGEDDLAPFADPEPADPDDAPARPTPAPPPSGALRAEQGASIEHATPSLRHPVFDVPVADDAEEDVDLASLVASVDDADDAEDADEGGEL